MPLPLYIFSYPKHAYAQIDDGDGLALILSDIAKRIRDGFSLSLLIFGLDNFIYSCHAGKMTALLLVTMLYRIYYNY